jgi:hypothetical protein
MQRDWRLPTEQEMGRVFHDHYHSYGLLMDSFESVTANVVTVLAASRTVPDNRLRPISLSRSGRSGEPIFNYRTGGERICITSRTR